MNQTIHFTQGIERFFWYQYNPKSTEPAKGIVLAGLGRDNEWYANTARRSDSAFDISNKESLIGTLLKTYLDSNNDCKIIPFIQYKQKEIDQEMQQFLKDTIVSPFDQVILVKPTREIGKRHFVTEYIPSIDSMELGSIEVIDQRSINMTAHKNINDLIDTWVSYDRLLRDTSRTIN